MIEAPWNASWSGERPFGVRPCRWANDRPALWQPHNPGCGRPLFAVPHMVRQRMSIVRLICTVCGGPTPPDDRWWFGLGEYVGDYYMSTEAPVHRLCADHALNVCPHLKKQNCAGDLARFPAGHQVIASMIGGDLVEKDFGVTLRGRSIVGALKLGWQKSSMRVIRRAAA